MLSAGVAGAQVTFTPTGEFGLSLQVGMAFEQFPGQYYNDKDAMFMVNLNQFGYVDTLISYAGELFAGDADTGVGKVSYSGLVYWTSYSMDGSSGATIDAYQYGYTGATMGVKWAFAENMSLTLDGYTNLTLMVTIPDLASIRFAFTSAAASGHGAGIVYTGTGTGWDLGVNADRFRVNLGLVNLKIDPITVNFNIYYTFRNTAEWTDPATRSYPFGAYWGNAWDNTKQKAGAMRGVLSIVVALPDLLTVTLSETVWAGFTNKDFYNDLYLQFDLKMVPNLTARLKVRFATASAAEATLADSATVLGALFPIYYMPITVTLAYALDLGGMTLTPYLKGETDLAGMFTDANFDALKKMRGWWARVGFDLGLAGGSITIPFSVTLTNVPDLLMDTANYGDTYATSGAFAGAAAQPLSTKILIALGIYVGF